MNIKLLVYSNERLYEIALNNISGSVNIGNRKRFKFYIKSNEKNCIKATVKCSKENCILKSKNVIGHKEEVRIPLKHGRIIQFGFNGLSSMSIIAFSMDKLLNVVTTPLKENIKFSIGRGKFNDIVFDDIKVSEKHAKIFEDKGKYVLVDLNSTNKTYLNGSMVTRAVLCRNDIINICGYVIEFYEEYLVVRGALHIVKKETGMEKLIKEYPFVQRAPRIYPEIKNEKLNIENPPTALNKPSLYGLMTIVPSLVFFGVTILTSISSKNNNSNIIFTAGIGISGLMYGASYISQNIVYKRKSKKRTVKYLEYIKGIDKKLFNAEKNLRKVLFEENPDLIESISRVKSSDIKLWGRSYGDEDFLKLRLGLGNEEFPLEIVMEKRNLFEEDSLFNEVDKISNKYNLVENVPICTPIKQNKITAVIGNRDKVIETVKNMMVQISVNHAPDEVKIVSVFDQKEEKNWEWAKWLPHVWDDDRKIRFMAENKEQTQGLFSYLYDILSDRKNKLDDKNGYENYRFSPHFVFVLGSRELIENEAILKFLLNVDEDMEISTIFLSDKLGNLPRNCNNIIHLNEGEGVTYNIQNSSVKSYFTPDRIDSRLLLEYSRGMAPLRVEKDSFSNKLPNSISLFEEIGIEDTDEIDFEGIWSESDAYKSLAVPIGIRENGEKFYLDLHQKQHGPHGLIAGTTGSGKSELLETVIASLSVKFSPEYVNFLLIDYKGGSMSSTFKKLPHVVGIVTNLEGNGSNRAIIAIDSEIKRREKILTELSYNNIDDYQKNYKLKKLKIPLPHLIIIVDEFAQLKQNDPEFIKQLVKVAVLGRSLGVHLILATQKPSGIVDPQIETNTNLKVCLRVQDNDDSRAVIGKTDASSISNPGRAYIKVGHNIIYEPIQTAFAGEKYRKKIAKSDKKVFLVKLDGSRYDVTEKTKEISGESETQISKIIEAISKYAKYNKEYELKLPWLPPLNENIYLDDLKNEFDNKLSAVVGVYDNPYNQCQDTFTIDIERENHLAVYGMPRTGKTIFLETFILSLASKVSPKKLNFYIIDCGNGTLNMFSNLVHTGEVVFSDDLDRVKKLLKFILKEIDKRKNALTSIGAISISDYNYKTGNIIAQMVFIIDDIVSLIALSDEFKDFLIRIIREGGSLGVHMVYSANSSNSVPMKIKENISFKIAYRLNDLTEYHELFRKMNGILPDKIAGRGIYKNEKVLEFQTALPVKAEEFNWATEISKKVEDINQIYPDIKVKKIPVLKEVLPLYEFIHEKEFLDYGESKFKYNNLIPVGVDTEELEGICVDFFKADNMLIAGDIGSGKTNFLITFVMTLAETAKIEKNKIYIVDSPELNMFSMQKLNCIDGYFEDKNNLSEHISAIKQEIEDRKRLLRNLKMECGTEANKKVIAERGNIFLIIDVIKNFKERFGDELTADMEWIMSNNKGTGIHIIVADDMGLFVRAWDGIEKTIKSWETGIIFSANIDSVFNNISVNFQYSKKVLRLGEGFLIVNKKVMPIKIPTPFEGEVKFIDYIDKLNQD